MPLPRRLILFLAIVVPALWATGFAAYSRMNDTEGWLVITGRFHDEETVYALMKKKCGSWAELNEDYTENYEYCRQRALAPYETAISAIRNSFLLWLLGPTLVLLGVGMAWYWVESADRR